MQGSYQLILRRGDEKLDIGVQSRPLGYSVAKLGAEWIKAGQLGLWDVYTRQGYAAEEHRGTLKLTKGAVNFDQRAAPLTQRVEGAATTSRA